MIYKNAEFFNVAELEDNGDGSVSWKRVPSCVYDALESEQGKNMAVNATGVEIRFVLKGEKATIKMAVKNGMGRFHVFRGGLQGSWFDVEVNKNVSEEIGEFVIEKNSDPERYKEISKRSGYDWDSDVIRVIFDMGNFKIFDIEGDICPPQKEQCPKKTLLSYGSSITHGSNSIDMSHSWVSVLAHNLNMDARNLGMAGSCAMEKEMAEYIASEGEKGNWDIATLELGINVLDWEEDKINERVDNIITQVATRNPEKKIFVISPFYYCGDDFDEKKHGDKWRRIIKKIVEEKAFPNVTYINGLDVIDNMSYMSADEVHPNIYGVQRIAEKMTEKIKSVIG